AGESKRNEEDSNDDEQDVEGGRRQRLPQAHPLLRGFVPKDSGVVARGVPQPGVEEQSQRGRRQNRKRLDGTSPSTFEHEIAGEQAPPDEHGTVQVPPDREYRDRQPDATACAVALRL